MNNSSNHLLNNLDFRCPADGGGSGRRCPADGGGSGRRRCPADGGGSGR
jgi:hypothetical protein